MPVSNRTLVQIAAYTGLFVSTGSLYMIFNLTNRVKQTEYYKEAFKLLRAHQGAVGLLGEPIKGGNIDLTDQNNVCNATEAQLRIPVKGPTQKGSYYIWAKQEDQKWTITRAELGLQNDLNRRLVIKKEEDSVS